MLREFVEQKHYKFAAEAPDWKEAIRMSCESLEADGTIEANYKEDIVACVEKYGPYIVLMPNIAMPHSQEGAEGVHKTSIGFMKLDKPVSFDPEDPERTHSCFYAGFLQSGAAHEQYGSSVRTSDERRSGGSLIKG